MDFERFDKLARTDRVVLLTALELLWQNGRAMIQSEEVSELTAACVSSLGGIYTAEKVQEVVKVCKELAHLETAELIRCVRCDGLAMKGPDDAEEGICPICGGELKYSGEEPLDDGGIYDWTCCCCGATGKEGYSKVFDRHYDVRDGNGDPYSAPSSSIVCAVEPMPTPCAAKEVVVDRESANTLPQADAEWLHKYFHREDWSLCFWGFTCFSRQNYAKDISLDCVDEILLGVQCIEGGTLSELAIRWHMLSGEPVPRLEVYDDAWQIIHTPTFAAFMEGLIQMCRHHNPTSDEVSALLIACGFTDQSDRPLGANND